MEFLVENQEKNDYGTSKIACGRLNCYEVSVSNLSCQIFRVVDSALPLAKITQHKCSVFETV